MVDHKEGAIKLEKTPFLKCGSLSSSSGRYVLASRLEGSILINTENHEPLPNCLPRKGRSFRTKIILNRSSKKGQPSTKQVDEDLRLEHRQSLIRFVILLRISVRVFGTAWVF